MIEFTVRGLPAPQGSKRAIVNRYSGRAAMVESSKRLKPWREDVRAAALAAMDTTPDGMPLTQPVQVEVEFRLPRPKGHYRTGRNAGVVRDAAPDYPDVKPDLDKLVRAILDAITLIVIADDDQVIDLVARKRYAVPAATPAWLAFPGVRVSVRSFR